MPQSQGVAGVGTLFRRWNGSAWVNISEIVSIVGPNMNRETIDVTSLTSTDKYRQFIAGFRNPGTVTLGMIFRRDTYDIMKGDFESDDLQNYEIILPDAENTTQDFEGLVSELPLNIPPDDKIACDVVIQVSGKVETESGSGSS